MHRLVGRQTPGTVPVAPRCPLLRCTGVRPAFQLRIFKYTYKSVRSGLSLSGRQALLNSEIGSAELLQRHVPVCA